MTKQFQEMDHTMGYFEVEGENGLERRTFHVVKGYALEESICVDFINRFEKALKEALPDQAEIHWRHRHEVTQEKGRRVHYHAYMRVTTHPELPETFWKKWESKEGEESKRIYP